MPVDALQIWRELDEQCCDAVNYYSRAYSSASDDNERKRAILERGEADFDQKYCPNDNGEREHYRTDYYVHGYMDMHIKQNLAALKCCFKDGIPQPLLFVDVGCGPMTAGLALAEVLSTQISDYKTQTAYFGVDASQNMVAKAITVNETHGLFLPENFMVVRGTQFNPKSIPQSFSKPWVAVLCLSFVLGPNTLRPAWQAKNIVKKLADEWKEYVENQPRCEETRIVYLNPLTGNLNRNWHMLKTALLESNAAGRFCYTSDKYISLPVESLGKSIYYDMVCGMHK